MVPGIAPSADPVLQTRMFAYPDAARYRLGANYQQIPSNAARSRVYQPYENDGLLSFQGNHPGDPNYVNSQVLPIHTRNTADPNDGNVLDHDHDHDHDHWAGKVTAFSSSVTDDDLVQPCEFWYKTLGRQPGQQDNFVGNVAVTISEVKYEVIRRKAYEMFSRVDSQLGERIETAVTEINGSP